MKPVSVFALIAACASISFSMDKSPVAGGIALGSGLPWIVHLKPELILRISPKRPSFSVFAELNSILLVSEYSLGASINFEGRGGYMNSIYLGSGEAAIEGWEEDGTISRQFMVGWELKKEYGHGFGYFLNCGVEHFQHGGKTFPKADAGFFILPGF